MTPPPRGRFGTCQNDRAILIACPPNEILIGGTPQKVDPPMKSCSPTARMGGRRVCPDADDGIPGDTKLENVKALIESVKTAGII